MSSSVELRNPRLTARIAGLFYLLTGGTGFAYFVRNKLVVAGDAAATAANVLGHEALFRRAIVADLLGVASYVVVTALFYRLFAPVDRNVSLVAAFASLMGCAVQIFADSFSLGALVVLGGGSSASAFGGAAPARTLALAMLRLHSQGFAIAIVFFGFYCLLVGFLILRSTFLPRILGALMALSGLTYVVHNLTEFLASPLARALDPWVTVLGGLGEGLLMLWLLVMGVNAERWREQAAAGFGS